MWPIWFKNEIAQEAENINIAINSANSNPNKEYEGVSLAELENARNLLASDPIEYFRSETFRHNYMCIQLQIRGVQGYEKHCELGKLYGNIHRKIKNWQIRKRKEEKNELV